MKYLIFIAFLTQVALAKQIILPENKQKSWTFESSQALMSDYIPLGEYVVEVVTPPHLLHSVSLPFQAQLSKLYKANYEKVKKGESLAELTATSWLEVQKKAISDAIEMMHHKHMAERKEKLCKEEIIAQKECLIANAELKTDKVQLASSKMLVRSYGASEAMIDALFENFIIEPKLPLLSPISGTLIEVNIQPGASLQTDQVLFTIVKEGRLWLESDIPQANMSNLKVGQNIKIVFSDKILYATVKQLSPVISKDNQTRHVRFELLKNDKQLLSGLRQSVSIEVPVKSIKISKSSLIFYNTKPIVFVQNNQGYESVKVTIVAETQGFYYVAFDDKLTKPLVTSGVIVLKTLMDGDND